MKKAESNRLSVFLPPFTFGGGFAILVADRTRGETYMQLTMDTIGHVETDLPEKFGVPRQSGLVEALTGRIVFDPPYRRQEALREIEGFSHLWVLWVFSASVGQPWHFTVRPPRLGGNRRVGVFASARRSARIRSGFPACGCSASTGTRPTAPACWLPGWI